MKKIILLLLSAFALISGVSAQYVTGTVYDAETHEPLVGATISYRYQGDVKGVISDTRGEYEIAVPANAFTLTVGFLGYQDQDLQLIAVGNETIVQNVYLRPSPQVLDGVVVSAGRYEQRLSDVTVSMEVISPEQISNQSPTDLRAVLNTLPGVDVTDRQPSIRGGSGWNYGVGSRSQVLVDGMSILTPGVGEINWNLIPMENIDQVEVIKGASSVLYGSSALNGLINVRTKRPGPEPVTRISAYAGVYGNPAEESYQWWDKGFWKDGKYDVTPMLRRSLMYGVRNPIYDGLDLSHTRRIGNFDVSGAVNLFVDEGYRKGGYNQRIRMGGNLTYHDQKVKNLNYGMNLNIVSNEYGDFFIWRSPKSAYQSSPLAKMARQHNFFYIDPFLNYYNSDNQTTHRLKGRFFYKSDNILSRGDDRNLIQIMQGMGVDGNSVDKILGAIQNPGDWLPSLLTPILQGDLNGLVNKVVEVGSNLFPNASQEDYVDLIAWVMNNSIPTSADALPEWALNALSPTAEKISIDKTVSGYADYQFSKRFSDDVNFTTGLTYEGVRSKSKVTGDHDSDNIAVFAQYDHKFFNRLNLSLGTRFEYYRVDDHKKEAETPIFGTKLPFKPLFRGGLNYQAAEYTFFRASFGQGYRYPSITEKFVVKDIGGVGAYPNADLKPERGYNVEIGLKQGYKFGPFMGFFDISGFYTYYKDMIEFNFGLINASPELGYPFITDFREVIGMVMDGRMPAIGVKFANVSRAEIYGGEFSMTGFCDIMPQMKLYYNLGYTYIEPIDVRAKERNEAEEKADILDMKSKSNTSDYLKYRQKHSVKGTFDLVWNRVSLGMNTSWKSKTLAVDYLMADERVKPEPDVMDHVRSLIFGDLAGYWKDKNKGYFLWDLRAGVKVTNTVDFQWMITNVLNKEYSPRPMDVAQPRTFIMKVNLTF